MNSDGSLAPLPCYPFVAELGVCVSLATLHASLRFALKHAYHERASQLADAILDRVRPCPIR